MNNTWKVKVKINRPVFGYYIDFYFYRTNSNDRTEILSEDSSGQKIIIQVEGDQSVENIKPTFRLNADESGEILKSLAEAIHNQGISTDNDAKISGLLEATKAHLEDMRKLVFSLQLKS